MQDTVPGILQKHLLRSSQLKRKKCHWQVSIAKDIYDMSQNFGVHDMIKIINYNKHKIL